MDSKHHFFKTRTPFLGVNPKDSTRTRLVLDTHRLVLDSYSKNLDSIQHYQRSGRFAFFNFVSCLQLLPHSATKRKLWRVFLLCWRFLGRFMLKVGWLLAKESWAPKSKQDEILSRRELEEGDLVQVAPVLVPVAHLHSWQISVSVPTFYRRHVLPFPPRGP